MVFAEAPVPLASITALRILTVEIFEWITIGGACIYFEIRYYSMQLHLWGGNVILWSRSMWSLTLAPSVSHLDFSSIPPRLIKRGQPDGLWVFNTIGSCVFHNQI